MLGGSVYEPLQLARLLLTVDRLDHEDRSLTRLESPSESFDQTERILALKRAEKVKGEEEDEAVLG